MNTAAIRQPITIANAVNISARGKTPTWEQGLRIQAFIRTDRQELRRLTFCCITEGQRPLRKEPGNLKGMDRRALFFKVI